VRHAVAIACAAFALAACTAAPSPPPVSTGVGLRAAFVLANPAGLLGLDESGRALGRIVDLPAQSAPATPVLHPSGKSIVFALTLQDRKTGFGSDLYTVNLDGSGMRPVVPHEGDNVFYASPRFDTTGNILYFHRRAAIIQGGSYVGNEDSLERMDLRTGERKRLLMNGADPTISMSTDRIVYVHLTQGQPDGMWTANIDGTSARPFFRTKDTWWYLQAPRFGPKGCEIVFSAAGHAVAAAPPSGPSHKGSGFAHVVPAWSPDGTQIAFVGTGGFFVLTLATGNVRTLAQGQDFFFGDLVWLK
jgi:Tol biopolymer transport system component